MIELGGYFWDFANLVAYRHIDYQNFNIRRKDCSITLKIVDGLVCDFDVFKKQWTPFSKGSMKSMIDEAYRKWLDDEIDKLVL